MWRRITRAWKRRFAKERYVSKDGVAYCRHPNGGGWVADSATVADDAFVHRRAMVGPLATVNSKCRLASGVRVGVETVLGAGTHLMRGVIIGDDSVTGVMCTIGPRSNIDHSVTLHDWVQLGKAARLGSHVEIHDGCTYGNAFFAATGTKSPAGEHHPGFGYTLGRGYPIRDPAMMCLPW